jgi:hypothetical protein
LSHDWQRDSCSSLPLSSRGTQEGCCSGEWGSEGSVVPGLLRPTRSMWGALMPAAKQKKPGPTKTGHLSSIGNRNNHAP